MKALISAAIKSTYETRDPGGVDRCIDVLSQLKSLSLSVKDILQFSKSIFKLETLRRHRHPKIREESKSLFDSWLKTLYSQGRDQSVNTSLTQFRLKPKKKENTVFSKLKRNLDRGSLTHDTKKETKTNLLLSKKGQDLQTLKTREEALAKIKTKTDTCKYVTTKQPCGSAVKEAGKISSVTATAIPRQSKQNIKDKDGNFTTKTLIPPLRRHAASSNPKSATVLPQQSRQNIKDKDGNITIKTLIPPPRRHAPPSNPKFAVSKAKIEEMVELFEAAKKAADVANTKGILAGKADASRCVEAISLLMKINVIPEPKEPRRMMERLEGLTKHKDRKICNAASALLQLWRQRITEQERKQSATKTSSNNHLKAHRKCGQGFTRESTKTIKLVI